MRAPSLLALLRHAIARTSRLYAGPRNTWHTTYRPLEDEGAGPFSSLEDDVWLSENSLKPLRDMGVVLQEGTELHVRPETMEVYPEILDRPSEAGADASEANKTERHARAARSLLGR